MFYQQNQHRRSHHIQYQIQAQLAYRFPMKLSIPWLSVLIAIGAWKQVECGHPPPNAADPSQQDWNKLWVLMGMREVDRFIFLIACPILLVFQIVILTMFIKNQPLLTKPGNIFFALVVLEVGLNLHLICSSLYFLVNSSGMPPNFGDACSGLGYVQSLFEINHFSYLFIFLFYIVFIIRYTLKKKTNAFWRLLHGCAFVACLFFTTCMFLENFIGLNFFGICGVTSLLKQEQYHNWNIIVPISGIVFTLLFLLIGIFTHLYYQKHMPEGQLKVRKSEYSRIIFLFVVGFFICELCPCVFSLVLAILYERDDEISNFSGLVTISNIVRVGEYYFTIFLIIWNDRFRQNLKSMLKKMFNRNLSKKSEQVDSVNLKKSFELEEIVVNEKLLQIKQQSNQIDLLFISQIFTIISGLYSVFYEYFQPSPQSRAEIKPIYFKESITIQIDNDTIKGYEFETRVMLKLQILKCRLTFFCPKFFRAILQADGITNIHQSFQIMENIKKICNTMDGQGGRSGEFFFFSADRKFVVKTITNEEFLFLKNHLPHFYEHYRLNPQTLIAKIYGLIVFKGDEIQRTYRLIIMKNITGCSQQQILRVYDLKGSKHNREVVKSKIETNQLQSKTLKDIDFIKYEGKLQINERHSAPLREAIQKDVQFLKQLNLIDYSFLVVKVKWEEQPNSPEFWSRLQRLPHNLSGNQYYHFGIIDYLQLWDFQKKSESWWKKLRGKTQISAINPKCYSLRFLNFIDEICTSYVGKPNSTKLNDTGSERRQKLNQDFSFELQDEGQKQNFENIQSEM